MPDLHGRSMFLEAAAAGTQTRLQAGQTETLDLMVASGEDARAR